ncbi:hypothetical protein C0993_011236 [Termitomyces sp. T159_Od127]|nr:hypothetical protein C0993_011236 [Termitomyces sp. T159_Od127]
MFNPHKFSWLKKGLKLSSGSGVQSGATLQSNNVHEAGSQRVEASGALASANENLSHALGEISSEQHPVVGSPKITQDHYAENSAMKSTWLGTQMLLKKVEKLLDDTPLKIPIDAVNVFIDLGNAISNNKNALQELFVQTKGRLEVIGSALVEVEEEDTNFRRKIEGFAQILELKTMLGRSTWKVILESDEDKTKIENIFKKINEETETFVLFINLRIEKNTRSLHDSLAQLELHSWSPSKRAPYDAILDNTNLVRVPCTKGTRIFWLTGQAGSGKSTIAYSVAEHFDNDNSGLNILQASFFCSRQLEDTRNRAYIIPTLVYQLAHNSKSFEKSLLDLNRLDSVNKLKKQMKDLLVDPWSSFRKKFKDLPPYLVVIDALDEIQNGEGSEFLAELLKTVGSNALFGLKFLVTSRPDSKILDLCKSFSSDAVCHLYDVAADEVDTDILIYLKSELPKLRESPELTTLMQQANGLFIYASTAVKFIRPKSILTKAEQQNLMMNLIHVPTQRNSPYFARATEQIDILYSQILSEALADLDPDHVLNRLKILCNILCAEERISTVIAAGLLVSDDQTNAEECSETFIQALHAVLYVKEGKVFWYHASFPDFIFSLK